MNVYVIPKTHILKQNLKDDSINNYSFETLLGHEGIPR